MTKEMEQIHRVAKYLGVPLGDVLNMKISEFDSWVEYMEIEPPLSYIVDTHLSTLCAIMSGGESIPLDFSLLLSDEKKDTIREEIQQKKIIKALEEFGNE